MAVVKECLVPSGQGDSLERRRYPEYESVAAICKATGHSYRDVYDVIVRESSDVRDGVNDMDR